MICYNEFRRSFVAVMRSLEFRNVCEITSTLHVSKYDVEKTLLMTHFKFSLPARTFQTSFTV